MADERCIITVYRLPSWTQRIEAGYWSAVGATLGVSAVVAVGALVAEALHWAGL